MVLYMVVITIDGAVFGCNMRYLSVLRTAQMATGSSQPASVTTMAPGAYSGSPCTQRTETPITWLSRACQACMGIVQHVPTNTARKSVHFRTHIDLCENRYQLISHKGGVGKISPFLHSVCFVFTQMLTQHYQTLATLLLFVFTQSLINTVVWPSNLWAYTNYSKLKLVQRKSLWLYVLDKIFSDGIFEVNMGFNCDNITARAEPPTYDPPLLEAISDKTRQQLYPVPNLF